MLWAPACDNGHHIGHHCRWRVGSIEEHTDADRNRLISTLIYQLQLNHSTAASEKVCARPPTPTAVWFHQIHMEGRVAIRYGDGVYKVVCAFCVVLQLVTH
jgi:hypothetical protein